MMTSNKKEKLDCKLPEERELSFLFIISLPTSPSTGPGTPSIILIIKECKMETTVTQVKKKKSIQVRPKF